jgi:20S proteasome subunit alpha 6
MFRNTYDGDNTTFSPQGRLHQVEYAQEAVKQGSAAVGLQSKTHAILLTLKRSTGELATYQKKMIRIDDHVGVAIAGLTSDARVLSNFMRQQAMQSRMLYARPIPIGRIVQSIADRAQSNTQIYGKRPYGVGFLVIGKDETGPHLYEFSPAGMAYEYHAHAIGARSQSARTYLEQHHGEFADASLEELIQHGLNALRDTLQQDKTLTSLNTSIAIIGPPSSSSLPTGISEKSPLVQKKSNFRILDDDLVEPYLVEMRSRQEAANPPAAASAAEGDDAQRPMTVDQPAQGQGEAEQGTGGAATTGGNAPTGGDGDGDVQMQE